MPNSPPNFVDAVEMQLTDTLTYIWRHPANRGRRGTALARAIAWQVCKRATGRPWEITLAGTIKLRCYPDSTSASSVLYCNGRPDYHEMGFVLDYLKPGDCFVDIGANIGVYALLAAHAVGKGGAVHAYEPGAKAAARLRENIHLNDLHQVTVRQVAVGEHDGLVSFSTDRDTTNKILIDTPGPGGAETVPLCTLDALYPDGGIALIKMDIEGAEPLALRGSKGLLAKNDPMVWLLEVNGALRSYGFTEQGLADWLGERDYDLAYYDADRRMLHIGGQPWATRENVLAVSRRHREAVANRCGASLILSGVRHA
jgi:FkbM family methyltransferase